MPPRHTKSAMQAALSRGQIFRLDSELPGVDEGWRTLAATHEVTSTSEHRGQPTTLVSDTPISYAETAGDEPAASLGCCEDSVPWIFLSGYCQDTASGQRTHVFIATVRSELTSSSCGQGIVRLLCESVPLHFDNHLPYGARNLAHEATTVRSRFEKLNTKFLL